MRPSDLSSPDVGAARPPAGRARIEVRLHREEVEEENSPTEGPTVLRVPDLGHAETMDTAQLAEANEAQVRGERVTGALVLGALIVLVGYLATMALSTRTSRWPESNTAAYSKGLATSEIPTAEGKAVATASSASYHDDAHPPARAFGDVMPLTTSESDQTRAATVPRFQASDVFSTPAVDGNLRDATASANSPGEGPADVASTDGMPRIPGNQSEPAEDHRVLVARLEQTLARRVEAEKEYSAAASAVDQILEARRASLLEAEKSLNLARERHHYEQNRLKRAETLVRKGYLTPPQRDAIAFALERAEIDLARAQAQRDLLAQDTRDEEFIELQRRRDAAAARLQAERVHYAIAASELSQLAIRWTERAMTPPVYTAEGPWSPERAPHLELERDVPLAEHSAAGPNHVPPTRYVADLRGSASGASTSQSNVQPLPGIAATYGVTSLPPLDMEATRHGDPRPSYY